MANTNIAATLVSAITLSTVTMNAIMYVEDTDIIITANASETQDNLNKKAQRLIHKWCTALWLTGGCLRPNKCWWYSIGFKWDAKGAWKYKKVRETQGDLFVPDHKQNQQQICRHEAHDGREGLGVHLAPDGNEKAQFDAMMDKAAKWERKVQKSYLLKFAADIGLKTTIMKFLGYPLTAVCLTESQCDKIMRPVLKAALPKMGANQNIGRVYVYGPEKYQGLELPNLYTELGIA